MSKIIPTGNVLSDIFSDFNIYNQNNTIIGQYSAKGIIGSNNLILGKNAGKIAFDLNNSILIGTEAGSSIFYGNRNIILGHDNSSALTLYDATNIGFNTINNNASFTIGNNLSNLNSSMLIGTSNLNLSINNSNISISHFSFTSNINLGFPFPNSSNFYLGNNLIDTYKFSLNIDNTICAFNSNNPTIYLGLGSLSNQIPIVICSTNSNNFDSNQTFIQGGLSTNLIKFNNNNEVSIIIKPNNNIIDSCTYYLPPLSSNSSNSFLATDSNGILSWTEVNDVVIKTIITNGDVICNDLETLNLNAGGNFLRDIYIGDKTTDDLREGIRNFYLTNQIITNYFLLLTSNIITTDYINLINNPQSNFYFSSSLYSSNFNFNIKNYVNTDIIKQNKQLFYSSNDYIKYPNDIFKNQLTTNDIKQGSNNLYFNEINFSKFSNNVFNIVSQGSNNLYYDNNKFQSIFNQYLNSNSTNTNLIIQGSSNLYYNFPIASNLINNFLSNIITTDNLREGKSNLYANDQRFNSFVNSKELITTSIKSTTNLDFFNSNLNYPLNTDLIRQQTNRYYNQTNVINTMNLLTTTDNYIQGNSNIYARESLLINDFTNLILSNINTDKLQDKNTNSKFITNNFYNNNLNINGFIRASNVNNFDLDILKNRVEEITIGPQTEVVNSYEVNQFNILSQLSNIQINYSTSTNPDYNTIPFIVIDNKVGIMNANPNYQLDVNGTIFSSNMIIDNKINILRNSNYELDVNGNIYCSNLFISNNHLITSVLAPYIRTSLNGNVGIGTANPIQKLHVVGNIFATGTITTAFSDIRLKTITSNLNNSLDIINKINGFKYKLNSNAIKFNLNSYNREEVGLNAQEIAKLIPEVVSIAPFDSILNENGDIVSKSGDNYLTINYERIVPYLIEAIKELKKENDDIKKINSNLEYRLSSLENKFYKNTIAYL